MRFALVFAFFTGGPPRDARDPWFGRDKWLHFAASAAVQGAAYAAFRQDARYAVAAQRAAMVTAAVGVGKELYDWRHPDRHDASWRDLAWDGVDDVAATVAIHQTSR